MPVLAPTQLFTPGAGPVGPQTFDFKPPIVYPPRLRLVGVTKDAAGNPLGNCTVRLFRTSDNLLVDQGVSDGSGNYIFGNGSPTETYYVVMYKVGAPDVFGTSVNTLVAV